MANYGFQYLKGSNRPSSNVEAADDADAHQKIRAFLKEVGGTLVPGSIRGHEFRKVPDPEARFFIEGTFSPDTEKSREAFFAHKQDHPESVPFEELTPLQQRMPPGGA
jgi:hypothetical protein